MADSSAAPLARQRSANDGIQFLMDAVERAIQAQNQLPYITRRVIATQSS
jgi:hypothetical protein